MKLSPQMLDAFAHGCYGSEIVEGAWRAHRLPPSMRSFYGSVKTFQIRMACTSGVRLRFVSDTKRLRVAFRYGLEARSIYQGSLLVDGSFVSAVGPNERQDLWDGLVFEQAASESRTFDLWLPHLCQADVVSVEVDDQCHVGPARPLSHQWLAYGDSITQGMTSTLPTRSVIGRCALALDAEVHNVALGSATAEPWMADSVPDGRYDVISIAYGTNEFDLKVPVSVFQQNVRRLLGALQRKHPGCPIVLLSPVTWVRANEVKGPIASLEKYRACLIPLAEEWENIHLVHGERLIPEESKWFVDDVHPNDDGFDRYAGNLLPHLKRALG